MTARQLVRAAFPPALRLGAAFLQFVATLLIARLLGGEKAGDFFFWSAILMYLGRVASLGLDDLSLQQVPRLHEDREKLLRFLGQVRVIAMVAAVLVGGGLVVYAMLNRLEGDRSIYWYAILPLGLAGVALCRINGEAMKGMGHPMLAIVYRQLFAGLAFLIPLVIVGTRLTSESALILYALGFAVAGLMAPYSYGFAKLKPAYRLPGKDETKSHLRSGSPMLISAIFTALTYLIPLVILEALCPPEEISFVTTAYRIFMLIDLLALAVHSIAMPKLSRAGKEKDWNLTRRLYRQSVVKGCLIMGLPLIGLYALAGPVMSLFGPDFAEAVPVLRVFLGFSAVSLVMGPAIQLALMIDSSRFMAVSAMVRTVVTILIAAIVVPQQGAAAMALAVGIGVIVQKGLCLGHFLKQKSRKV